MDQNISNNMTIASKLVSFFEGVDYVAKELNNQSKKKAHLVRSLLDIASKHLKDFESIPVDDKERSDLYNLLRESFVNEVEEEISNFEKGKGEPISDWGIAEKIKSTLDYDPKYAELRDKLESYEHGDKISMYGLFPRTIVSFFRNPQSLGKTPYGTDVKPTERVNQADTSNLDFTPADDPVWNRTLFNTDPMLYSAEKAAGTPEPLPHPQSKEAKEDAWGRLVYIYKDARLKAEGEYRNLRRSLDGLRKQYSGEKSRIGFKSAYNRLLDYYKPGTPAGDSPKGRKIYSNISTFGGETGEAAIYNYIENKNLLYMYDEHGGSVPDDSFSPSNPENHDEDYKDNLPFFQPGTKTLGDIEAAFNSQMSYDQALSIEDPDSRENTIKDILKGRPSPSEYKWRLKGKLKLLQDSVLSKLSRAVLNQAGDNNGRLLNSAELDKLLAHNGPVFESLKDDPEVKDYFNVFNAVKYVELPRNSPRLRRNLDNDIVTRKERQADGQGVINTYKKLKDGVYQLVNSEPDHSPERGINPRKSKDEVDREAEKIRLSKMTPDEIEAERSKVVAKNSIQRQAYKIADALASKYPEAGAAIYFSITRSVPNDDTGLKYTTDSMVREVVKTGVPEQEVREFISPLIKKGGSKTVAESILSFLDSL